MPTVPPTPVTTVKPLAAALFLTRGGGFAWVRYRSNAELRKGQWLAEYQAPGCMHPGRYETRMIFVDDDGHHSAADHRNPEDLVRLCKPGHSLTTAASVLAAYIGLLRVPFDSDLRLELCAVRVNVCAALAQITGEDLHTIKNRYEALVLELCRKERI